MLDYLDNSLRLLLALISVGFGIGAFLYTVFGFANNNLDCIKFGVGGFILMSAAMLLGSYVTPRGSTFDLLGALSQGNSIVDVFSWGILAISFLGLMYSVWAFFFGKDWAKERAPRMAFLFSALWVVTVLTQCVAILLGQ